MRVTIFQIDIEWGRPLENIRRAEQLLNDAPKSDLYVLPEMWSTGFATEPQGIAEDESSSISLQWMRNTAKRLGCAISGSLAIRIQTDNGFVYKNRHYFVNGRSEMVSHYDKHHLFSYGHEDQFYESGAEQVIVEYLGVRFLLLTCYDLRFPVWSRLTSNLQYDCILVVANWPDSRQNAWEILTRARAIENQAIVIGCNRVGQDHYSNYEGHSMMINPIGNIIAECPSNHSSFCSAELDIQDLIHKRTKFKVSQDADAFQLK